MKSIQYTFLFLLLIFSKYGICQLPEEEFIKLWFSSDSLLVENELVSILYDKSSNLNNASQSDNSLKPTRDFDSTVGPIIHFGGDVESPLVKYMNFTSTEVSNQEFSIFILLRKSVVQNITNFILGGYQQGVQIGGTFYTVTPSRIALVNNPVYNRTVESVDNEYFILSMKSDLIKVNSEVMETNNWIVNDLTIDIIGSRPDRLDFFFHGDFVEFILYEKSLSFTEVEQVENYIRNKYSPPLDLGQDIITNQFCDTVNISSTNKFISYLWSNGSVDSVITVSQPGKYWCSVTDIFGFQSSDTIKVIPPGNYLKSFSLCANQDSTWNTQLNKTDYSFYWQDGSTDSIMVMDEPGAYYCSITSSSGCTYDTDTVLFEWNSYTDDTHLPQNPTICASGNLSLETGAEETISYAWYSDASPSTIISTEDHIIPNLSQDYWLLCQNEIGCIAIDTTSVTLLESTPSPVVGFSNTLACGGQEVLFSDTSVQEESTLEEWEWSTNNGQASTLQNPAFTFEDYGEVLISLKVFNEEGCSAFIQKQITVHPSPMVNLANYDNLCTNTEITFQDSSTIGQGSIDNWQWVIDGDTLAPQNPPNKVTLNFDNPGSHMLSQVVTSDSGCVSNLSTNLDFRGKPLSSFVRDTVCIGTAITLSATSDTSGAGPVFYEWIDQNGDYLGGAQNLSIPTGNVNYPNPNVQYPISLVTHTSDAYCSDTLNHFFRLESLPNVEIFRDQACLDEELTLSASADGIQSLNSYAWSVENVGQGTESTFSFTPIEEGYIQYSLLSSTQFPGCETLVSDSLKIYTVPNAMISGPSNACLNTNISYEAVFSPNEGEDMLSFQWTLNDAFYSNDTSISILTEQSGFNQLDLLIVNAGNCENTAVEEIEIYGAIVNIEYIQTCEGTTTQLFAIPDTTFSGPTSSNWRLENGDAFSGHSLAIDLGAAGEYWVVNSITDLEHNCIDEDSILVKVSSYPVAFFEAYSVCEDQEFTFLSNSDEGNDPIDQTSWLLEDGSEILGESLSHIYTEPGDQSIRLVVVTEEAACMDTLEQTIGVYEMPMANFSFNPETGKVPLEVQFSNTSDTAFVYTWFLGTNDISFEVEPQHTFTDTAWVKIKLLAESAIGCQGEKLDSIYIHPPKVDIEVIEVIPVWDGDYVSIKARIRNNGYYTVNEFESLTSIGSNSPLKKLEVISIAGEEFKVTDPASSWYFNPSQTQEQAFACVEVNLADGSKDEFPSNDKKCVSLYNESFVVYDPFPNPGSDELTIRINLPESGQLSIALYSSIGELVLDNEYDGMKGFNQVLINTVTLSAGTYSILISYGEKEKSFSWVKG